jgi:8-amino-7-oxononanoate synthase
MSQASTKSENPAHADGGPGEALRDGISRDLAAVRDAGLERFLRRIDGIQDPRVTIDGRKVLLLCSNNYLGLASHPEIVEAACRATRDHGTSAVSSRLISGHMSAHAELEKKIAHWKSLESALVFTSGYQANVGTISALAGPEDVVVSDELNHASIIDGCRLSKARVAVYRHNDVEHLREVLSEHSCARRILVVTESIFSMDGDAAPLREICDAADEFGASVMVDEAHAAGVFGPGGAGLAAELGLTDRIDVHVGTLGKALAGFGAYVAGSAELVHLLVNKARAFIFTTGLPPAVAAAADAAIDVVEREPERAAGLRKRARALGRELIEAGLEVPNTDSQILPVLIGPAEKTVGVANRLLERGIYVAAIRPPTVPKDTSRLRVSLMATHTEEDIALAARTIVDCVREAG